MNVIDRMKQALWKALQIVSGTAIGFVGLGAWCYFLVDLYETSILHGSIFLFVTAVIVATAFYYFKDE